MPRRKKTEEEIIKKIDEVNEKMKEINKEPIKKVSKPKAKKKQKTKEHKKDETFETKKTTKIEKTNPTNNKRKSKTSKIKEEAWTIDTSSLETIKKEPKEKLKISLNVKKTYDIFEVVLIIVIVSFVGVLIGYTVRDKKYNADDEKYTKVSKELQTFIDQYNYILDNYYGDIDKNELIKDAIQGMFDSLDAYSNIIDENTSNSTMIKLEGKYEGLGIEIYNDNDGNIVVLTVFEDSPAAKAGIKVGDIITKFNENVLAGKTTTEFVNMVKETEGKLKLEIKRDDETFDAEVSREKIILDSVTSKMLDEKTGYISISIFATNTDSQFEEALKSLEAQGMKGLIIDVRGNSGGHLSSTQNILCQLLDGSHIIYQTENKKETDIVYSSGTVTKSYPIVVLVDINSASASEVLAGALQQEYKAYIIGTRTFGKGTVQELNKIDGIGEYKFTTKKWLTPNGTWVEGVGIQPDLEVLLDENYANNPTDENDKQLQAAIQYLKDFKD